MHTQENMVLMLEIFSAIERRDERRALELFDPDVEFHWPGSLPYGGTVRSLKDPGPSWSDVWNPLQPTDIERRMDPRIIAARDNEVVLLWRQRGLSPAGDRFDGEVLGLYQIRSGKLVRAQMFHFDTAAVARFLANATGSRSSGDPRRGTV